MTENAFADLSRAYVAEHGAKAALSVLAVILEETAKIAPGKPPSVTASINASLIRRCMGTIV